MIVSHCWTLLGLLTGTVNIFTSEDIEPQLSTKHRFSILQLKTF